MLRPQQENLYLSLAKKEQWDIIENKNPGRDENKYLVIAENQEFALCHPFQIHLTLYKRTPDPWQKFVHMKAAHDYLWPDFAYTWNHWDERRFIAHCEGHKHVILAGGASCAKSHSTARIALLWWLSDSKRNTAIIASTTLESLEGRIWGYVAKFVNEAALPLGCRVLRGKPPKVMRLDYQDKLHGMFAVPVRQGEDDTTLSTIIGRHPDKGLLVVLDEATDIPAAIAKALPNLEKGVEFFQLVAIGNSNSKFDLHGALATPKIGWDKIDPMRDYAWETEQGGVCLYFNPYDSPAIRETDPAKKAILSKFLATDASIEEDKRKYGDKSDSFYRFVLGFWRSQTLDNTLASQQFLDESQVFNQAEWSGFYPLQVIAGLDPAFAIGGTGCVLRLAVFGQTTDGLLVMDFRKEELLFRIDITATGEKSGELQLAEQVIEILKKYNCPVNYMAMDVTGPGRALAELIKLVSGSREHPMRISSSPGTITMRPKKEDPTSYVSSPSEMWFKFREFIHNKQIKGLDYKTAAQLSSRLTTVKNGKVMIESKAEYRTRMTTVNPKLSHSPDEADAAILCLWAAVLRLGYHPGQKRTMPEGIENNFWNQKMWVFQKESEINLDQVKHASSATRPPLVPNFSHSIEDIPKLKIVPEEYH